MESYRSWFVVADLMLPINMYYTFSPLTLTPYLIQFRYFSSNLKRLHNQTYFIALPPYVGGPIDLVLQTKQITFVLLGETQWPENHLEKKEEKTENINPCRPSGRFSKPFFAVPLTIQNYLCGRVCHASHLYIDRPIQPEAAPVHLYNTLYFTCFLFPKGIIN